MPCFTSNLCCAFTFFSKNYLFPGHKRSCTFKYSRPFAISSFNSFKTCYSTAFVLYCVTTSSTLFHNLDPLKQKVFYSLNPHTAKIIHPLLTLTLCNSCTPFLMNTVLCDSIRKGKISNTINTLDFSTSEQ